MLALILAIYVDQNAYATKAPKLAIVTNNAKTFSIRQNNSEVLKSETKDGVADFSGILTPGDYELVAGNESATLHVKDDPYSALLAMTIKAFHDARCGVTCHLKSEFHKSSGHTGPAPSVKGWHDAGDYGRYTVNSAIATSTLLYAAEMFGAADIADEARWNVDWMASMQDTDGGVWHKQTSLDFAPFVMPQDDKSTSYIIGKGSCATADFAATLAIASRVYNDNTFSKKALDAWRWLSEHPNVTFRNPQDVKTGEYGDRDCSDERLWAAAEIFRTTGYESANNYFIENYRKVKFDEPPSWKQVGPLAAWSYRLSGRGDAKVSTAIEQSTIGAADAIVARAQQNRWRSPMLARDYVWGSNGVAANYGLQLIIANAMRPNRAYVDGAADAVHYLLGRNAYGLSFVTGTGSRSVMHPHHRPSAADGVEGPWPGLLAGGPNRNHQDPVLRAKNVDYIDEQGSYASNEVAINWNAPLVFVLRALAK
jgi:endoglucanase